MRSRARTARPIHTIISAALRKGLASIKIHAKASTYDAQPERCPMRYDIVLFSCATRCIL